MLQTFSDISAHFSSAAYRFDTQCSTTPTPILTIRTDNFTQATTTSFIIIYSSHFIVQTISVAVQGVCGRSFAGIAGSNPARGMYVCLL
jgi:hypothetical protein